MNKLATEPTEATERNQVLGELGALGGKNSDSLSEGLNVATWLLFAVGILALFCAGCTREEMAEANLAAYAVASAVFAVLFVLELLNDRGGDALKSAMLAVLTGLAFASMLAGCALAEVRAPVGPVTLARVIDGDTVLVTAKGERMNVRLIGVDAPEKGHFEGAGDARRWVPVAECHAHEARRALALLVEHCPLRIVGDPAKGADRYGRVLGYLEACGTDAGLWLIENGLARYGLAGRKLEMEGPC